MPKHAPFRAKFGVNSGEHPTTFAMLQDAASRFWARVAIKGADECWDWQSFRRGGSGHGKFQVNRTTYPASRIALQLDLGRLLDRTELACHRCDNPPCCNPTHLFAGSVRDNALDAKQKGRLHTWEGARRGSSNPCARLNETQVREIFSLRGTVSQRELGRRFGVSGTTIRDIMLGKLWGHVTAMDWQGRLPDGWKYRPRIDAALESYRAVRDGEANHE